MEEEGVMPRNRATTALAWSSAPTYWGGELQVLTRVDGQTPGLMAKLSGAEFSERGEGLKGPPPPPTIDRLTIKHQTPGPLRPPARSEKERGRTRVRARHGYHHTRHCTRRLGDAKLLPHRRGQTA